ncbi:hypothetical protein [Latilactobacillus fragifolii]|uniref:hypothetical protein n=1 Tax=Latilactobacillus fragifolii TaxID=2814244 RepID=UPI001ABB7FE0|nr:hypothetical protein [Latilactobacillus fragifolii]
MLDEKDFINEKYLGFTEATFFKIFGDELILKNKTFSNHNAGMGYFKLIYLYPIYGYEITFEYENLLFTIKIKYGSFVCFLLSFHEELNNRLDEQDIFKAIKALKKDIQQNNLEFYKITKSGDYKRVKK